jgi:putative transposase
MKKRYSDEQIIRILRKAETSDQTISELCRQEGLSEQSFYRWKRKLGGMDVPDAKRLKALDAENTRLKKIVAEQALAIDGLKEIADPKW